MHDSILSMINHATPQNPVAAAWLYDYSEAAQADIDKALNDLYALAKVNRCKHTKFGVTDDVYWPTGVTKLVADYGRNFTDSPLRREAIIKEKTMSLNESNPSTATDDKKYNETAANKPNALKVLEFIQANPNCSFREMRKNSGVDFPLAYIKTPISRGKVIATKHEDFKCTYKLADGWTADAIYYKKDKPPVSAILTETISPTKIEADTVLSEQEAQQEEYEIPAFLRIPASDNMQLPLEACIESLLPYMPDDCHITLRHPIHQNIQVEIDGTILANPMLVNLDKVGAVFSAIKTLQDGSTT